MTKEDIRKELYPTIYEVDDIVDINKKYIEKLENKIIELDKQIIKEI